MLPEKKIIDAWKIPKAKDLEAFVHIHMTGNSCPNCRTKSEIHI